jgi:hypothetical protein
MEFTDQQRLFLRGICDYFHTRGVWPTLRHLDRALKDHDGLDVQNVDRELYGFMHDGPGVSGPGGFDSNRQVSLSVSALHSCQTEGIYPQLVEDLDAFIQVLRLCIERNDESDVDYPQVISAEVHDRFDMSDSMSRKVFILVMGEGLAGGSSTSGEGETMQWSLSVSPMVRDYRRVLTLDDYLHRRQSLMEEARKRYAGYMPLSFARQPGDLNLPEPVELDSQPLELSSRPGPTEVQPTVQLQPISLFPAGPFIHDEHLCFVLMPFAEELRVVYDNAIAPASTDVGLECQRADDIMKPGGVMAQVWQALMEARVVIADLTGMNPNVFYELGLAHTIGHDVILLTQDKKWVPFDLQHMRWLKYQPDDHGLYLLRSKLRKVLKDLLAPHLSPKVTAKPIAGH